MVVKKRGLGRGLEALLGAVQPTEPEAQGDLRNLPVELLRRGKYQPRVDMRQETLQELADSIRAQGVVQPIVVRPVGKEYEIIAGERRWRAAQLAGLSEVPCVVRNVPDQAAVAMALIENIQRENLNPLEEANALQRLIDEFDMTHAQAAEAVGRSRAAVSNLLRLRELSDEIKHLIEQGALEMGHARALLGLPPEKRVEAARHVAAKGLSVRETEQLVRRLLAAPSKKPAHAKDPNIQRLEQELSEKLGTVVEFRHGTGGKGQMVIQYNSLEELDGILEHLK
ncbi:MAG: ParB/RepB/Spo0J family partition protein [Gammaproteobacteria bacterium]